MKSQKLVIISDFSLFSLFFSREIAIFVSFPQKSQLIVKSAAISTTWERLLEVVDKHLARIRLLLLHQVR
jgi:hypothetical protein